jgi:hypothetical protein
MRRTDTDTRARTGPAPCSGSSRATRRIPPHTPAMMRSSRERWRPGFFTGIDREPPSSTLLGFASLRGTAPSDDAHVAGPCFTSLFASLRKDGAFRRRSNGGPSAAVRTAGDTRRAPAAFQCRPSGSTAAAPPPRCQILSRRDVESVKTSSTRSERLPHSPFAEPGLRARSDSLAHEGRAHPRLHQRGRGPIPMTGGERGERRQQETRRARWPGGRARAAVPAARRSAGRSRARRRRVLARDGAAVAQADRDEREHHQAGRPQPSRWGEAGRWAVSSRRREVHGRSRLQRPHQARHVAGPDHASRRRPGVSRMRSAR